MKISSARSRALAVAAAGCAAIAALGASGTGFASTAGPAARPVVIVNCGRAQVEPTQFVLACADGNAYLKGLHWVSWHSVAFGSGTEVVNDCSPTCVGGKFYSYPALITVWRAAARPGHHGQQYFSRLTVIHTGKLSRPHAATLPLTQTFDLFPAL